MVTIVRCPVCKETIKVRDHQRFFIHCKLTSIVKDNFVAKGATRAKRLSPADKDTPPASQVEACPGTLPWDICGKCHSKFPSFGENVPEKCPVCGHTWKKP